MTPTDPGPTARTPHAKRVWTCDHCGAMAEWSKGWAWYDGVKSACNPGYPWATCSKACEMATDYGLDEAEEDA